VPAFRIPQHVRMSASRTDHRAAHVRSDPELSVQLTERAADPVSDRIVIVEGTNPAAIASQARQLARDCGVDERRVVSFRHLWSLGERDVA
jgi:hypothetical protein